MVHKKCVVWVGLFFLLAVFILPCNGMAAEERKEIRIGAINSMTGPNVLTGAEQKWAYEQAVADINAKGGVYVKEYGKKLPIKLIFADDKSSADQAAAAMERLIKIENIDLGLSSNVIPMNVAAATVAEKYRVFFSMTSTWLDEVEKQKFKWVSDFFFTGLSAAEVPFIIWKNYLPEGQKIERPALMMQDTMDGQGFGGAFKYWAKEYGYKFVLDQPYAPGSMDFASAILKLKASKADALLWFGTPTDAITLMKQIRQAGVKLKYIHGWMGMWTQEFQKALGKKANYVVYDAFWSEVYPNPGAAELGKKFKEAFDKDSVSIGFYYANVQVLAKAIEKAGSIDSEKVRDAVFGGEFKGTVTGDLKFNEKGLAFVPSLALQWWNGKRMPVYPPVPEVWHLKLAPVK